MTSPLFWKTILDKIKTKAFLRLVCIFLALITSVAFVVIRKQPWEYIVVFFAGALFGVIEKYKRVVFWTSLLIWAIATLFDPLIKSMLDLLLSVNTVPSYIGSLMVNSLLLFLFWIGYLLSEKIIKKLAPVNN